MLLVILRGNDEPFLLHLLINRNETYLECTLMLHLHEVEKGYFLHGGVGWGRIRNVNKPSNSIMICMLNFTLKAGSFLNRIKM